jgi:two-component system, NarL family, invasion response regulator UvrY
MLNLDQTVLKVLIADDHAIVRKGLREILRESAMETVVGEASNGNEALDMAHGDSWDVVVLDITMPGPNGLEVLRRLKKSNPKLPVLMLSMHSGRAYVDGSIKAGASGYLSKETAPDELVNAIHAVLEGGTYISKNLRDGRVQG